MDSHRDSSGAMDTLAVLSKVLKNESAGSSAHPPPSCVSKLTECHVEVQPAGLWPSTEVRHGSSSDGWLACRRSDGWWRHAM